MLTLTKDRYIRSTKHYPKQARTRRPAPLQSNHWIQTAKYSSMTYDRSGKSTGRKRECRYQFVETIARSSIEASVAAEWQVFLSQVNPGGFDLTIHHFTFDSLLSNGVVPVIQWSSGPVAQSSNELFLPYITDARPVQRCCRRLGPTPSTARQSKTLQLHRCAVSKYASEAQLPLQRQLPWNYCRPTKARSGESENKLCYPPVFTLSKGQFPFGGEQWIIYVAGRKLATTPRAQWILIFISITMKRFPAGRVH